MGKMTDVERLLKRSGFSNKAINYYTQMINVGKINDPSVSIIYTGPCGDTMEFFLKISSDVIKDAKFQTIGCVGAFVSASALTEMIKGKTLGQVKKISEEDIIKYIGGLPPSKINCVCLARRTLEKAIERYKGNE